MAGAVPIGLFCMFWLRWLIVGNPLPTHVEPERLLILSASGIIGFWLSSIAIVHAFVRIGPRLSLLIASLGPLLSAVWAWIFLGQVLDALAIVGIALTISGIAFVVSEGEQDSRDDEKPKNTPEAYRAGILFAMLGALGQSFSFVLSSQGVAGAFDPLSAALIRLFFASAGVWLYLLVRRQGAVQWRILWSYPQALRHLMVGAISGPVIGASFVLVSLQHTQVGIASTLSNLTPIFLIPVGYIVFKERITRRAIAGTVIAMIGTAVLFL